jgi:drug/metabolite transporter (DMT)-like permease
MSILIRINQSYLRLPCISITFVFINAIVLAVLILNEQITVSMVLEPVPVITGVYLTNAAEHRR